MTSTHPLIDSIVDHVTTAGSTTRAARHIRAWAAGHPALAGLSCPARIVETARRVDPAGRDLILSALVDLAPRDEWAQLTALAILAPRLAWIVASWARHPGARAELADLEADLVAECWTAIHDHTGPPPHRLGLALVDSAWARVRDRRARQRRHAERHQPLTVADPPGVGSLPGELLLAESVTQAVTSGDLHLAPARALYLTRVVGLTTTEAATALNVEVGTVRALRSRAARRLAA